MHQFLILNYLPSFSVILVFTDRNFRIDNDSWSMYIKPVAIQFYEQESYI